MLDGRGQGTKGVRVKVRGVEGGQGWGERAVRRAQHGAVAGQLWWRFTFMAVRVRGCGGRKDVG